VWAGASRRPFHRGSPSPSRPRHGTDA
jgi:hypothetical protein